MNAEFNPYRSAQALPGMRVRPMTFHDLSSVLAIENASYAFPWSDGVFRDCIRVGYVGRVLEFRGELIGYALMSMGAGEAHILNVCVRMDHREQGLGRYLISILFEHARASQVIDVFLEVRPSNLSAIQLYENIGFQRIGLRKAYYQANPGREDAWVYKLTL